MTEALAGYEAARRSAALFDRPGRALLRLRGRDPVRMVQGIITNDLAGAPDGQGVYAAVLTPKGKMVGIGRVFRHAPDGGAVEVLFDAPAAAGEPLRDHFVKSIPPLFAKTEDLSAEYGMLGVYGPDARGHVTALVGPLPDGMAEHGFVERAFESGAALCVRTLFAGVDGYDLIAPTEAIDALRSRLLDAGVQRAGDEALDLLRIEAGRPRWGADLDADTIPLEAGLRERVISETKGCYTGQEVIIRILHRGHVNRHLRGLLLGQASPPSPGTELTRPGESKVVARVTSAGASPAFGQTIALGYVRREVEPPAELVTGDGVTARVVALPFPDPA